jgi:hypothetical protein
MSVGIRLYDARHFHIGADHRAYIVEVPCDLAAGDEDVRSEWSGHLL